ncbi:MAG: 2-hydroxyacyl-CoA dehydratase [Spirochaetes bacterium]|nr:2-hydroxyacyl-CoA dehydratase [Spirochaetota bacterium]
MNKNSEMFMKPFARAVEELRNPYVRELQDEGRRIMGFFCSYIPMELIAAAGLAPFRVKGLPGKDIGAGTTYLSTRLCTFSRNALSLALEDDYSFLDGFIGSNTCDQIRRTSQNWIIKKPAAFNHFVHVPRVYRDGNISFFRDQLACLKEGLEVWTGRAITDDDLRGAIEKYNRARGILRGLSALRRAEGPRLSGAHMLTITVAYHQMPVDDFIPAAGALLESLVKEKAAPGQMNEGRARVLLCGGMIDEPEYVAFMEEQGFDVVADPVCFGMRSYRDDADTAGDPLEAIAARSLTHFPCPHIGDSFFRRWDTIREIYDDYRADGIIFQRLIFCQIWGVDAHNMTGPCDTLGIPLLNLEREYGFFSSGQLKTRLQAFHELIEQRKEAV